MATLVLGPLLRHVGERHATVWVETDEPCEVEVLGARARTFSIHGHHYALVVVEGLEPATAVEYGVALDGERVWPLDGEPPSTIRTLDRAGGLTLAFGSCRAAAPHRPPWTLTRDEDELGYGPDALHAYAQRLRACAPDERPHVLVLLGDQVYVDEAAPETRAFARSRRDTSRPPYEGTLDFAEYAMLYRESWGDPTLRWLLSTVSTAMIFDDHELHDDWNISAAWVRDMRRQRWWDERAVAAFSSYWLYQHLGNLDPASLRADETYTAACETGDGTPMLRALARGQLEGTSGTRWSYARDLGCARLVVVDSRAGRVLEGTREMLDEEEWRFVEGEARADVDHVLLATSIPYLLGRGIHDFEAWNERVCAGAWGSLAARLGEKVRRAVDLDHWAAFQSSFARLARLLAGLERPASVLLLSGDVHYSYVAETTLPRVRQLVVSPMRNLLAARERRAQRFALSRVGRALGALLSRASGAAPPPFEWRLTRGPWFDNAIGTLVFEGRSARLRLERAIGEERLETVLDERLC
ncbi:MAG TPA: alkaline phosphatase D family protein [Gaiellaceae bacterium]|nr:alkaline phosphatase D family protein [Gaiellaceae bacterium]